MLSVAHALRFSNSDAPYEQATGILKYRISSSLSVIQRSPNHVGKDLEKDHKKKVNYMYPVT